MGGGLFLVHILGQQVLPARAIRVLHRHQLCLADEGHQQQERPPAALDGVVAVHVRRVAHNEALRLAIQAAARPLLRLLFVQVVDERVHRAVVRLQLDGVVAVQLPLPRQLVASVGRHLEFPPVVLVAQVVLLVQPQAGQDGHGALHQQPQAIALVGLFRLGDDGIADEPTQFVRCLVDVALHLLEVVVRVVVSRQCAELFRTFNQI